MKPWVKLEGSTDFQTRLRVFIEIGLYQLFEKLIILLLVDQGDEVVSVENKIIVMKRFGVDNPVEEL